MTGIPGTPYEFELLDKGDQLSEAAMQAFNDRDFEGLVEIVAAKKSVNTAYDKSREMTTWKWAQRRGWEE